MASSDHIIFPSWAAGPPTVNVNRSASTGSVRNVTVEPGYAYGIGTRENPLFLKSSVSPTWTFNSADAGDMYVMSSGAVSTVNVLQTGDGDDALHLAFARKSATSMYVTSGNVTLDASLFYTASSGVGTLRIDKQDNRPEPVVAVESQVKTKLLSRGGTAHVVKGTMAHVVVQGGTVTAERSYTGLVITASTYYSGKLFLKTSGENPTVSNAISVKGDIWSGDNFNANAGQTVSFTS